MVQVQRKGLHRLSCLSRGQLVSQTLDRTGLSFVHRLLLSCVRQTPRRHNLRIIKGLDHQVI
jgi:hypothetical protein